MVGQGLPTLPPLQNRTCAPSTSSGQAFHRIRLLSNRAIVIGTTNGDCSLCWLGLCTFRSRYEVSGFQSACASAIKHDFCQSPDLPGYPPHVSVSPALPRALASWGILLRRGLRPGRLLLPRQREHTSGFPVPCIHLT
jgi:hypothetical protein